MSGVLLKRKAKVRSRWGKAERMIRRELRVLCNLPEIEAVHQVGGLSDGNGTWNLALGQAEMVHTARVIIVPVADKNHAGAIDVE